MSKDTTKNLVGQPVFKQIINILTKEIFDQFVIKFQADRYYKKLFSWEQLITLLFGILSRCDSMGEICDSMRALGGKLNYLNLDCSPSKSTAGDALRNRNNELYKEFYFALLEYFRPFLSVSRKNGISFKHFYAFDSTTISLFSEVMIGVGHNRKDDGRKKGGLKVHMLTDIHADTAVFATISEAKMHDKKFLSHLSPANGSMLVFDKAYNYYNQYAEWTENEVFFVSRLKENAKIVYRKTLFENKLTDKEKGVFMVEKITLIYKENKVEKPLNLRLVHYRDEKGRKYKFISNNWEITPEEVALIYKCRWSIELTFKKLKQNFQLHFFYSETENGIKTQIWCTLIAHLLLNVIMKQSKTNKAFSIVAALVCIHLISHLDIFWVVAECRRYYIKLRKQRNKSPNCIKQDLTFGAGRFLKSK